MNRTCADASRNKRASRFVSGNDLYSRADALVGLEALLAAHGVDARQLAQEVGIPVAAFDEGKRFVPWEAHNRFLELAARRTALDDLGIRHALVLYPNFDNFGPLPLLTNFCRTLREWIELASKYTWIQTNAWLPQLLDGETDRAVFRCLENPTRRMCSHLAEGMMLTMYMLVQKITHRQDAAPLVVRFHSAKSGNAKRLAQLFNCPVEFGCEHNELVFEAAMLEAPIAGRLSQLRGALDFYVKRRISRMVRECFTISQAVEILIGAVIGTDLCCSARVAEILGMSEKKMQRLLRGENSSFRDILQKVRMDIAMEMVLNTAVDVGTISGVLGYKSPQAFIYAFVVWTGSTPTQLRYQSRPDWLVVRPR